VNPNPLRLVIDSDAFCKLAAADLLDATLSLLGVTEKQCARLPTLLYMLRKGRIRNRYGYTVADGLIEKASIFSAMPEASAEWLDKLAGTAAVDPGEAQMYALAAEHGLLALTGDKRALKAVSSMPEVYTKLDGKVVTIEAVLLGLSLQMAEAELRARGKVLGTYDQMAKAVFASANSSLHEALGSYFGSLEADFQPMKLWRPDDQSAAS
jgi:hypothetical protein